MTATSPPAAGWRRHAEPRDVGEAVRTGSLMLACAAAVIMLKSLSGLLVFGPWSSTGRYQGPLLVVVNIALVPLVLFGTALWGRLHGTRHPLIVGMPVPVAALTLTGVTNTLSHDASAGSQMFLVLPVLYAAYFLRPLAAGIVTAWAGVMAVMTVAVVSPREESGLFYFATALAMTALMVSRAQTAAHDAEAELAHMAGRDALTGLASRWVLDEAAQRMLETSPATHLSLIVLDVDLFKDINDAYGHPGGDAALMGVADHLRAHARDGDMVSRLGGDEFAVLMVGHTWEEALARGNAIVEEAAARDAGPVTRFTLSAGLAHAPGDATDLAQLYVVADRRLYAAKQAGRNRLVGPDT